MNDDPSLTKEEADEKFNIIMSKLDTLEVSLKGLSNLKVTLNPVPIWIVVPTQVVSVIIGLGLVFLYYRIKFT